MGPVWMLMFLFLLSLHLARAPPTHTHHPTVPPYMLHLFKEAHPPAEVVRSLRPATVEAFQDPSSGRQRQLLTFTVPPPGKAEALQGAHLRVYATLRRRRPTLKGIERLLQLTLRSCDLHDSGQETGGGSGGAEASPATLTHVTLKGSSWFTVNITATFTAWSTLASTLSSTPTSRCIQIHVLALDPFAPARGASSAGRLELTTHGQDMEPMLVLMYDIVRRPDGHNVVRRSSPGPGVLDRSNTYGKAKDKSMSLNQSRYRITETPYYGGQGTIMHVSDYQERGQGHNIKRRSTVELEDYEEESNNLWDEEGGGRLFPQPDTAGLMMAARAATVAGKKKTGRHRNLCRRSPLYVDFMEIEYDSWIVAPSGYEAYQCVGKCFYPVSEHLEPTKHAIIQTLLHTVAPRRAPRACCVPTRLQPISLMYLDEHGVLTYRFNYEDMVVAECGCR